MEFLENLVLEKCKNIQKMNYVKKVVWILELFVAIYDCYVIENGREEPSETTSISNGKSLKKYTT
jgi:hypothetical protein